MTNSATFTLRLVELEFDRVQERHHNQLKLRQNYQNSPEMVDNLAVIDTLSAAILALREVQKEYRKSL